MALCYSGEEEDSTIIFFQPERFKVLLPDLKVPVDFELTRSLVSDSKVTTKVKEPSHCSGIAKRTMGSLMAG